MKPTKFTEAEFHKKMGVGLFNDVWRLLEKTSRTPSEDDRMIHEAHASRYHWQFVGEAKNFVIGEWQISRVYSTLGRPEPALYHARRCVQIAEENQLQGFVLGSAYEGMARAIALSGDPSFSQFVDRALAIATTLTDAEEKNILESDLRTIEFARLRI